jgi:hypothetical protein
MHSTNLDYLAMKWSLLRLHQDVPGWNHLLTGSFRRLYTVSGSLLATGTRTSRSTSYPSDSDARMTRASSLGIAPRNTPRAQSKFGCYVDKFIYFSTNCRVEECFEASLAKFMGLFCWFLSIYFLWGPSPKGMWVHLLQARFIQALLLKYKLN